ncbi:MAG: hypothetical protein H6736_18665 [Alphaproteobacteria bacterium]|nr:hypothetical protein [Alphaproteobacteria bacterium]
MIPIVLATALALDCTTLDAEVCAATEAIAASIASQAGEDVVHDGAEARFQPATVYGKLLAARDALAAKGCETSGWSAGLYLRGRWDGEYEDGGAPGTWTGSVSFKQKTFTGTNGDGSLTMGASLSGVSGGGKVVGDIGPGTAASGIWIRRQGPSGVFAALHAVCPTPDVRDALSAWLAPVGSVCPDVDLVDGQAVQLDALIDPLAPTRVRLVDGDGTLALELDPAPPEIVLPPTTGFRDFLGAAIPRLEVDGFDGAGNLATCAFDVLPVGGAVCRIGPTRTCLAGDPCVFETQDDCVAPGSPDLLTVVAVEREDGSPVPFDPTPRGGASVALEPGAQELFMRLGGGGLVHYTGYGRNEDRLDGVTGPVGEDGGVLDLDPLYAAMGSSPDDPLEPVRVDLIGPDDSILQSLGSPDATMDVASAPVLEQGLEVVNPRLRVRARAFDGSIVTAVFEIPVNRAPQGRAGGPVEVRDDGSVFVPATWMVDPEGGPLEVLSVVDEGGGDLPFTANAKGITIPEGCCGGAGGFTIVSRDTFLMRLRPPPTIGTGTFTIMSRDIY